MREGLEVYSHNVQQTNLVTTPNARNCVTEHDTKICELGFGQNNSLVPYVLNIGGGEVFCMDAETARYSPAINGYSGIVKEDPQFCVSDTGNVELSKNLKVKKYWGEITSIEKSLGENLSKESFYVPRDYRACIWAFSSDNNSYKIMSFAGSNGPYTNQNSIIHAFCLSGDDQVDFYTN